MLYAMRGPLAASARRFMAREYRDTARHQNRSTGLKMAFTAVLLFGVRSALLATGGKMPPAGRRTAHKRLEAAGGYRDIAAHAVRPGGRKKARPTRGRVVVVTL